MLKRRDKPMHFGCILMLVQCTPPCGPHPLDIKIAVCVHWICLISLQR